MPPDHRFCFEHFGCSHNSILKRVKALGANLSMNPYYSYLRAGLNGRFLGVDRA
eukprot:CAMPEP_0171304596 /NCGR_PEP_ID=MMETSP0816-20121228/14340_1 /TAXON_ID=420281 /ORGANISM="Proboscia inermis, Strain CCAP1064/1" /LENGTH=53 /DNA_ID=CAMNT_0011784785 /DNA_START=62 /DNA_END=219 /DNA_ORIENTATION=-